MTKLITIDYDEYIDLCKHKEILEDALNNGESYCESCQTPFDNYIVQRLTSDKLFDYLMLSPIITKIEIVRSNNDKAD